MHGGWLPRNAASRGSVKLRDLQILAWLTDSEQQWSSLDDIVQTYGATGHRRSGSGSAHSTMAAVGQGLLDDLLRNRMNGLVQLESDLQVVLALMELRGVHIDASMLKDLGDTVGDAVAVLEGEARTKYPGLMITSHVEVRKYLYDKLKLDTLPPSEPAAGSMRMPASISISKTATGRKYVHLYAAAAAATAAILSCSHDSNRN